MSKKNDDKGRRVIEAIKRSLEDSFEKQRKKRKEGKQNK